ncbi:histidine phosphatase superfamily [Scleroderma yunnanense]
MSKVLGALVIARNGDREEFTQDSRTYEPGSTRSTPLGAAESYLLGSRLRAMYLSPSSPSYITGIKTGVVDTHQVHFYSKAGGEGTAIFDSTMALLQGLFPPNPNNKITLANETTIVAPLGGYQYVPIETVEPSHDHSLEPWTDCLAFQQHISEVYASESFKATAKAAQPFFQAIRDFVFGRPTTLENAIFDYINTQLIHNQTYAYRLPPTLIEQARGFADYHENAVFSDSELGGIGNLAGRTILHSILESLDRITFNGDSLKFLLIETSYQPFISLFHMLGFINEYPELAAIPNFASALALEIRRGPGPEIRDFLRIKFKNGSNHEFQTYHAFGHKADIPITEFVYKLENYAITSQKQWNAACNLPYDAYTTRSHVSAPVLAAFAALFFIGVITLARFVRKSRTKKRTRMYEPVTPLPAERPTEKGHLPQ